MDSSSPIFDEYAQDLTTLIESIQSKLNAFERSRREPEDGSNGSSVDENKSSLNRINRELEESDEIMGQMEIEVQTETSSIANKRDLQTKLKQYKNEIVKIRQRIKQLESNSLRTDRDELLSAHRSATVTIPVDNDPLGSNGAEERAQRSNLMSKTDQLNSSQRRLEESHRVALETEDLGAGILRDLRGQRDVLEHAREGLYEADGSIDRASNTIGKMVRTMHQQKFITYAIVGLLILLILYVLVSKLFF